jgi:hypothetical protein
MCWRYEHWSQRRQRCAGCSGSITGGKGLASCIRASSCTTLQVYSKLLVEVTQGRDLREAVRSAAKDIGMDLSELQQAHACLPTSPACLFVPYRWCLSNNLRCSCSLPPLACLLACSAGSRLPQ